MRPAITGTSRARRRARAAGFRRVMLRIIGTGLLVDAAFRLVVGRSLASFPLLQQVVFLLTGRRPRPHPPRWQEWLLGLGEGAAAFRVLNAAPFAPDEIARTLPDVYQRTKERLDRTLLASANDALVNEVARSLPEAGRLLVIGDPSWLLSTMRERGIGFGSAVVVDESDTILGLARQRLGHAPNVTFLRRTLAIEPIPGVGYDVVAGNWMIGAPYDVPGLIARAEQVLAPDGTIVLILPTNPKTWWSIPLRPVLTFFGARLVERGQIERLSDLCQTKTFAGGLVTLVVLRREIPRQGERPGTGD